MATEFTMSALWWLCKSFSGKGPCKAELLQLGAFHKLLLVLQVGCMGMTKKRARSFSSSPLAAAGRIPEASRPPIIAISGSTRWIT
jgi:hypothetical protein